MPSPRLAILRNLVSRSFRLELTIFSTAVLTACSPESQPNLQPGGDMPKNSIPNVASMAQVESGYDASSSDWVGFLSCWRDNVQQRLIRGDSFNRLPSLRRDQNVIAGSAAGGFVAAAMERAQRRVKTTLPKSYADFVIASAGAGWLVESIGDIDPDGNLTGGLWSIDRIGYLRDVDADGYQAWITSGLPAIELDEYYFRYGYSLQKAGQQDPIHFGLRDFSSLIVVGNSMQGGLLLLNAAQQTKDGEMEAWSLDSATPGAIRYRSFAEMMVELSVGDVRNAGPAISSPDEFADSPCAKYVRTAATK